MASLAYSLLSTVVLPPSEYLLKHLLTDHLIGELSVVTIIDSGRTTSFA